MIVIVPGEPVAHLAAPRPTSNRQRREEIRGHEAFRVQQLIQVCPARPPARLIEGRKSLA